MTPMSTWAATTCALAVAVRSLSTATAGIVNGRGSRGNARRVGRVCGPTRRGRVISPFGREAHPRGGARGQKRRPSFWDDADAARATMEEIARAKEDIAAVDTARGELSDARAALELAEEMGDDPDAAALREELLPRRSAFPAPSTSLSLRAGLPGSSTMATRL